MFEVINLYIHGEPDDKSDTLKSKILESNIPTECDFKVFEINFDCGCDSFAELLKEQNMTELPVLLVDNTFLDYENAITWVENYGKG